jgi:hypothetical protein
MALDIKLSIINNKNEIIVVDSTGDYNAITNPTGWGAPNPAHTNVDVTSVRLTVTNPSGTIFADNLPPNSLYNTTFWTSTSRAYEITVDTTNIFTTNPVIADGIWKFVIVFTILGTPTTVTKYALRDNVLKCQLGQLALGDMDTNSFEEAKLMYDKMVQAFECGEYVLAQQLYQDISDFLSECDTTIFRNCGC